MDELIKVLENTINEGLVQVILSNSQDREYAAKVKIRPVLIKGVLYFQETIYRGTQVFHENFSKEEITGRITELLQGKMKQCEITAETMNATVLVSKKGKMTVKTKRNAVHPAGSQTAAAHSVDSQPTAYGVTPATEKRPVRNLSHNREKQYILQEGVPVDFLVGLGVQTPEGRIAKNRYDKFRQINRYLEFIEDILEKLPADRTVRIIDFGCGKSYLTFAMYYYLHILQKRDITITGLDLKKDVIAHCNDLAAKCGYDRLHFEVGDISTYEGADAVDMVVSLHACDTATDYAIEKALKWGATVIMAVPCCQHEVNKQISCGQLQPVLKYGLIKERVSALITDAIRANLLEEQGYDTQIVEFIDMEHTPKNLLIRAVKRNGPGRMKPAAGVQPGKKGGSMGTGNTANATVDDLLQFLNIQPTLKDLLDKEDGNEITGQKE